MQSKTDRISASAKHAPRDVRQLVVTQPEIGLPLEKVPHEAVLSVSSRLLRARVLLIPLLFLALHLPADVVDLAAEECEFLSVPALQHAKVTRHVP